MSSVVIRPGALGDIILTIPLLESIRAFNSGEPPTLLGSAAYRDLIPGDFGFDAVDGSRWTWLFGATASPAHGSAVSFERAFLILNRPEDVRRNLRDAGVPWIRHVTSRPAEGIHLVEHLHRGLGLSVPPRRPALTYLSPPEKKNVIWLHPGSGGPRKCAPLSLMAAVAVDLMEDTGWDLAVTVGEADDFLKTMPEWDRLVRRPRVHVVEQQPLASLCARLGSSRIFLGNDSGISHLAAGLGIPSVVFFVATDPVQWAPWVPDAQARIVDWRERRAWDLNPVGVAARNLLQYQLP